MIVSGFSVENPNNFSDRIIRILELGLNIVPKESENNYNEISQNQEWESKDMDLDKID
eukprot:CAMPEP_0114494644 /NCGR_PEP_ID=MMETSP0109-20121206/4765_1 /TAXON_ID=29199 /ORGANISM="Chlorarachnion reptans, Strain CCCM449" /LENGTH=57 /DNA_ID=CAMNT_0001671701 /DNA_START=537 /DNA_END=710 /DNA_ORIENTATION=-